MEHKKMKRIMIVATAMGLIFALWAGVALAQNMTGNNDTIVPTKNIDGNDKDNWLDGTNNADTINGKGGDDFIYGLKGKDKLNGGDGNDFIDSVDGNKNDDVNCGSGKDDVAVDKKDDVNNCEKVERFSL
jgi:Ca2+-binding RTX toxin-like protein